MAITINGSGSITGISAGGLPDGSVTAADLASGAITSGALPSGSVLQVVQGSLGSAFSTTSISDQATGLSATITPSSSSNKILVMVTSMLRAAGGQCFVYQKLWRGAVGSTLIHTGYPIVGSLNDSDFRGVGAVTYLDSPLTTSAVTYTVSINANYATTAYISSTTEPSTITLMEIAG